MKIYTKNGDGGETSLLNGKKVLKNDPTIELIGSLDELNAYLGQLHTLRNKKIRKMVLDMQADLFSISAELAGGEKAYEYEKKTKEMEETIDILTKGLPELKNFILPGGSKHAAQLHLCRASARKLERQAVGIKSELNSKDVDDLIKYLNRMSDLLFVMARYVNFKLGIKENIWKK
ncbi:cob(I)yrinic acid a,c-diamide adenosyltransferase [Patescibacteria group bacterium]